MFVIFIYRITFGKSLPCCEYYKCEEQVLEGIKRCIFHDENYLKGGNYDKNKDEVAARFQKKLEKYISEHKPLEFSRYFLPDIPFRAWLLVVDEDISFENATFYGKSKSDFSNVTFNGKANFHKAVFTAGAEFSRAFFKKEADFWEAKFSTHADTPPSFYYAIFSGEAKFTAAEFNQMAIFGFATFSNKAIFTSAKFFKGALFMGATFSNEANFRLAKFLDSSNFLVSTFSSKAYFSGEFNGKINFFNEVIFEEPTRVTFDVSDMSNVSFSGSDVTKIRFSDKVTWGDDNTIIEEKWLIEKMERAIKKRNDKARIPMIESVNPELVLSVYRNLRENYEFRLRYGDAGKFFIKEMELKRKYTETASVSAVFKLKLIKLLKKLRLLNINAPEPKIKYVLKQNGWLRRHFSLTGLYYHLSKYGESIVRPTIIGIITVGLSTLFWLMQSKPTLEPHFFISSNLYHNTSHFVYLNQAGNPTQWLAAFQRSLADFLPVLSLPGDIKVGIINYITKIVGGALTFGLLIIAFRRKFERKYTR